MLLFFTKILSLQNPKLMNCFSFLDYIVSVIYYFTYKRAMIKLSDPKYYRDTEWLRKELARIRWDLGGKRKKDLPLGYSICIVHSNLANWNWWNLYLKIRNLVTLLLPSNWFKSQQNLSPYDGNWKEISLRKKTFCSTQKIKI